MKNNLGYWLMCWLFLGLNPAVTISASSLQDSVGLSSAMRQDTLTTVLVEAPFQKDRALNPLVYGSGRSFSTEDAYRYAGSLGDVGRMLRNYAGVSCLDDSRNDVSVRGNSPCHLLWRIDGYEINNPNHYATVGLTGSTVALLNTNLISNSDFLMGAFPAEFGNALSGVFDLHMRPAAADYRFRVQTGWNGFELGAEGPFRRGDASGAFLVAYRYSFLDILSRLGLNTGINPKYQDLSFKLHRDLCENWRVELLGIWGKSLLQLDENDASLLTASSTAFLGTALHYDNQAHHRASVRLYANKLRSLSSVEQAGQRAYHEAQDEMRYTLSATWDSRARPNHYWQMGAGCDLYDMQFFSRTARMYVWHVYAQDEYRFSSRWKLRAGWRVQGKSLEGNRHQKWEPRAALQWRISQAHRLALSYGRHHQTQVHSLYLYGASSASNLALDFSQSDHYCLSYDWSWAEDWRLKADVYYQYLSDLAVEKEASAFSAMNIGNDFYIPMKAGLLNDGLAKNYGLELTLEKFLSKQYYAMLTAHLYRSRYCGSDGVWRNSAYDLRHVFNAVAGYQFECGKSYVLGVDAKLSTAGGKPGTPFGSELYSARYPPYFRSDIRLFCQYKGPKIFYEFAVDLQNVSHHKNLLYEVYHPESQQYTYYYQTLFSPMYTFRVLF